MKIRIGTRGSDLARWQAGHISELLTAAGAEVEIKILVTRGDRIDDVPLHLVEGKAFFTKEIEDALLNGEIDVAVHSHKDLAVESAPGLCVAAVPTRASAVERLLVRPEAHDPDGLLLPLRAGARVGTSAPRRQAQVTALRPDVELVHLRGNVPTRVKRCQEGRYDAIVLAAAGLDRLELDTGDLINVDLPLGTFVPAPGQGALAIQVRSDDTAIRELVTSTLHDDSTATRIEAERALLTVAGGGCNLALGAVVEPTEDGHWQAQVFRGPDASDPDRPARWALSVGPTARAATLAGLEATGQEEGTGHGPLAGVRVAMTGTRTGGQRLRERLVTLGAQVISEAVIECTPLADAALQPHLDPLGAGDVVVFTSRQAVAVMDGASIPEGVLVAAVGPVTASALEAAGQSVGLIGEGGARDLARRIPLENGARVLHPCAVDALPYLSDELRTRGTQVLSVPVYETRALENPQLENGVDARVYLSPSAARAAADADRAIGGESALRVALGTSTAQALEEEGLAGLALDDGDREGVVQLLLRHALTLKDPR